MSDQAHRRAIERHSLEAAATSFEKIADRLLSPSSTPVGIGA